MLGGLYVHTLLEEGCIYLYELKASNHFHDISIIFHPNFYIYEEICPEANFFLQL